jgi:hypothetical protein
MEKKRKGRQNRPDKESEQPVEEKQKNVEISRPRIVAESKCPIQQGIKKTQQRKKRELVKTRGVGSATRPSASRSGLIQRHEKKFPTGQTVDVEEKIQAGRVPEEQGSGRRIAWVALVISLASLVLFGAYSLQKFSPEFEFHDLKTGQEQIAADVQGLKLSTSLEKVKSAILHARTQLLLHKDYSAAESMLTTAKQEMEALLEAFPTTKEAELRQILHEIENTLQSIRRGPLSFDERLKEISSKLDKM